jgi:RES domain-containing protein
MVAWRLIPKKHARDAFSGEGARIAPGRWNLRGTRAVYLSGSLSLAALETLLYTGRAALTIPFMVFRVELPDDLALESLAADKLPSNWREQPPPESTRRLGSEWIARGAAVALRVPSVVVPEENDLLVNPVHPDFRKVRIAKAQFFRF